MVKEERLGRILIVDDDPFLRDTLTQVVTESGYRVEAVGDAGSAFAALEAVAFEVVVLDLGLPDVDGLEVLGRLAQLEDRPTVVVLTGRDDIETIVEAMKRGAENFLIKPADIPTITVTVAKALQQHRLYRHAAVYQESVAAQVARDLSGERQLVGASPAMQRARELVMRVAPTDSAVVLLGESGTGKGMAARLIHRLSQRASGPFVDLPCAALPATLVESEVFGHERGAFTDAKLRKPGLLEVAHGGTMFLDEVAELEASAQSKLLKVIEERSFRRVGGVREVEVDVRFVVATHVDLKKAVETGRFRGDLFYRLNVFQIEMPPLRERGEDVLELAFHFIGELNPRIGRRIGKIAESAAALLLTYSWPGNVRELRNVIERAMILATGDTLTASHLPEDLRRQTPSGAVPALATLEAVEGAHIAHALKVCQGNVKLAASRLGISRSTLYSWMERIGLEGGAPRIEDKAPGERRSTRAG
jgi:two-component system, NtrC family, response regulator AtoC